MKRYDVQVEGQTRAGLGEDDIKPLFRAGLVGRDTPCRISGTPTWRTVEDVLPLLKYECSAVSRIPSAPPALPIAAIPVRAVSGDWVDRDDEGRRALTTSLKAGWICFGLGAATAWIFFPAYFFYSVALIMAIVAMCTRQVPRGLILLLSTFVAMGTSAMISFLVVGTLFAGALGAAAEKAERDREVKKTEIREMESRFKQALDRSLAQLPTPIPRPPVEEWSPRELLDEISRVEQRHRVIRKQGRDVSPSDLEYLNRLRSAQDKAQKQ